jgi:predicted nucleic acid-binding protein
MTEQAATEAGLEETTLLDSNILLRTTEQDAPQRAIALAAVETLQRQGTEIFITPQNLIEFWAVATRPQGASNGLGMSLEEAEGFIEQFLSIYSLAKDTSPVFEEWLLLVKTFGVSGKPVHDARLVAVMKAHGTGQMLTFNTGHFQRYAGPTLMFLHPDDVAGELAIQ